MIDGHWTQGQSETPDLMRSFQSVDQNCFRVRNKLVREPEHKLNVLSCSLIFNERKSHQEIKYYVYMELGHHHEEQKKRKQFCIYICVCVCVCLCATFFPFFCGSKERKK